VVQGARRLFIHARFTVSTGGEAARLRHLRANAACSAAHMDGDTVGIVVHGQATIIGREDPAAGELEPVWRLSKKHRFVTQL